MTATTAQSLLTKPIHPAITASEHILRKPCASTIAPTDIPSSAEPIIKRNISANFTESVNCKLYTLNLVYALCIFGLVYAAAVYYRLRVLVAAEDYEQI